jgi:hypothetical protein
VTQRCHDWRAYGRGRDRHELCSLCGAVCVRDKAGIIIVFDARIEPRWPAAMKS